MLAFFAKWLLGVSEAKREETDYVLDSSWNTGGEKEKWREVSGKTKKKKKKVEEEEKGKLSRPRKVFGVKEFSCSVSTDFLPNALKAFV